MTNIQIIIITCWLTFLTYWLYNWHRVKPSIKTSINFKKLSYIVFLSLALAFFLKTLTRSQLANQICHPYPQVCNPDKLISFVPIPFYLQILSLILIIGGLIIAVIARRTLADNWSGNIDIKKDHRLITTGIYRNIRHPIYTGVLSMTLGTFINLNPISAVILFSFVFTLLLFKLKKEEELLTRYFPVDYPAYKSRTKALIPFLI